MNDKSNLMNGASLNSNPNYTNVPTSNISGGPTYPGTISFNSTPEKEGHRRMHSEELLPPNITQPLHHQPGGMGYHRRSSSSNDSQSLMEGNANRAQSTNPNNLIGSNYGSENSGPMHETSFNSSARPQQPVSTMNAGGRGQGGVPSSGNIPPKAPRSTADRRLPGASSKRMHSAGSTASGGSFNKYSAGGARRTGRAAYVDLFNKDTGGTGMSKSASFNTPMPGMPIPAPAMGASASAGPTIFRPAPLPSSQPSPIDNSNNSSQ